jgi:hypothetical protein
LVPADDFVRYGTISERHRRGAALAGADRDPYVTRSQREDCMAENKSPNPKRMEILLAWLGMAGAVALLWWLVAE